MSDNVMLTITLEAIQERAQELFGRELTKDEIELVDEYLETNVGEELERFMIFNFDHDEEDEADDDDWDDDDEWVCRNCGRDAAECGGPYEEDSDFCSELCQVEYGA